MRSCPACGAANGETDDFCGNCGAYLGWSRQEAPPAQGAARAGSGSAASTTGGEGAAPTASARENPQEEPPPLSAPTAPAATTSRTPPQDQVPDEAAPVTAVQPAKPATRRPATRTPVVRQQQEGPPCPKCGVPNQPGRRFCRRCAEPLVPTPQAPVLPWWRKVWPLRRRVRGGSGRLLRGLVVLAVVLALAVGGLLLLPAGRGAVEDIRDKLGKATEVGPAQVSADAQVPRHPASAATDGLTNTYWGAPAVGASVSCRFTTPFRLVGVVVHSGASKSPEEFRGQARPVRVDLVVTSKDGTSRTEKFTLNDKPGPQTARMGISDVVEVRLVVRAAAGAVEGRAIALGEVEFFKRS